MVVCEWGRWSVNRRCGEQLLACEPISRDGAHRETAPIEVVTPIVTSNYRRLTDQRTQQAAAEINLLAFSFGRVACSTGYFYDRGQIESRGLRLTAENETVPGHDV